jgi:hypothetical protein
LRNSVHAAVDPIRAAGIDFFVGAPTLIEVGISATITVDPNYPDPDAVIAACVTACESFVNGIGLDPDGGSTTCPYGKIYGVLYGVPGVQLADNLLVNGGTIDIVAPFGSQLVAQTPSLSQA